MIWRRKENCKAKSRARSVGPPPALVATHEAGHPYRMRRGGDRIAELQLENSRLRRLVTDLLLEKIKLEEAAQSRNSSGFSF
jgi:putative transposase